jgi:hypothetical protein
MANVYRPIRFRDDAGHPRLPALPPNASVSKRWKFRRNAAIYVLNRNGFSQRVLADVFDLPRSRIATIVKEFSEYNPVFDKT